MSQTHTQTKEVLTTPITDLRRYISTEAKPGSTFEVKISGAIPVANGKWELVDASQLKAAITGKVPNWIPGIGGKEFSVELLVVLLNEKQVRVTVSGSVAGSAIGNLSASGDELKIQDLKLGGHLKTITSLSLTRWYRTETRASFYHVPLLPFWFQTWFVPTNTNGKASNDYPSPSLSGEI